VDQVAPDPVYADVKAQQKDYVAGGGGVMQLS